VTQSMLHLGAVLGPAEAQLHRRASIPASNLPRGRSVKQFPSSFKRRTTSAPAWQHCEQRLACLSVSSAQQSLLSGSYSSSHPELLLTWKLILCCRSGMCARALSAGALPQTQPLRSAPASQVLTGNRTRQLARLTQRQPFSQHLCRRTRPFPAACCAQPCAPASASPSACATRRSSSPSSRPGSTRTPHMRVSLFYVVTAESASVRVKHAAKGSSSSHRVLDDEACCWKHLYFSALQAPRRRWCAPAARLIRGVEESCVATKQRRLHMVSVANSPALQAPPRRWCAPAARLIMGFRSEEKSFYKKPPV